MSNIILLEDIPEETYLEYKFKLSTASFNEFFDAEFTYKLVPFLPHNDHFLPHFLMVNGVSYAKITSFRPYLNKYNTASLKFNVNVCDNESSTVPAEEIMNGRRYDSKMGFINSFRGIYNYV